MVVSEFIRTGDMKGYNGSGIRISRHDGNGSKFRIEVLKLDEGFGNQVVTKTINLNAIEFSNLASALVDIEEKCGGR